MTEFTPALIGGSLIGWGLSGLCPGPAIASLAMANRQILIMLAAMAVGMMAARFLAQANSTHR